MVYDISLTYFT